ncbi:flagella assembly protein j [Halogeometricum borinquense DSM 11551]|uniref:Flagella assembly protein j n=2 Tax=Halogeometricum borinquense TaxID=60847 RepID=E4NQ30_HALBP|nr:type II secretion system F family protein [Halogeometricum borinquense]ADQ67775.1 archaeal flagella assembly protein J [Halogeometricum borinquense DSM 11551]ELY23543.1 flagella assembly protein j [Halogeometricum borinquense DSM 11551]RYJ15322.1 secretion system protein [Halogeometricum borinquense]
MVVGYLPLVLAVIFCLPVVLSPVSSRANLFITRISLPLFGWHVMNESPRRRQQESSLRAAFVGESHRVYSSKTLLMSAVFGIAGSVFGVYFAALIVQTFAVPASALREALPPALGFLAAVASMPNLSVYELFGLVLVSSATVGATLAAGTYVVRWEYLDQRARARRVQIDAALPQTIAFIYALSRSGMPFQKVLATLTENQHVYGEAAREFGVAVNDVQTFGTDLPTALRRMAERTPSQRLDDFTENLTSVLTSGQSLSAFLHEQYDRFQAESEAQQQQYLELLATFAEVYVTVLVAGPLFLITILVVVGLVMQDTLPLLRVIIYLGLPLASVAFVVYVDSVTESLRAPGRTGSVADADDASGESNAPVAVTDAEAEIVTADGGVLENDRWRANRERLAVYDRLSVATRALSQPGQSMLENPLYTLAVTLPLGLIWIALTLDVRSAVQTLRAAVLPGLEGEWTAFAAVVDGPLVELTLLSMGGITLAYELRKRRLKAIEREMPDFLDRMASVNEAGVTVVKSLHRLAQSDLGPISEELRRTWRDIQWGASLRNALRGFDRRAQVPMVSRAVTLIMNAVAASGEVAPVLRIAANEAQDSRRLLRERRQEMMTYLVVIYISFFVFLGIVVALTLAFIPSVEAASQSSAISSGEVQGVSTGVFSGLSDVDTTAYELLFFHAATIQAICSGLIAGQLGEGRVFDGLKHAVVLLTVSYALFVFL